MSNTDPQGIDPLLDELRNFSQTMSEPEPRQDTEAHEPSKPILDNATLETFIFEKGQDLVQRALTTIAAIQPLINHTIEVKALRGFAEVVKATTAAIDTLNNLNLENKKFQNTEKLKAVEHERKLELAAKKQKQLPATSKVTNNIIATREDVLKFLTDGLPTETKEAAEANDDIEDADIVTT